MLPGGDDVVRDTGWHVRPGERGPLCRDGGSRAQVLRRERLRGVAVATDVEGSCGRVLIVADTNVVERRRQRRIRNVGRAGTLVAALRILVGGPSGQCVGTGLCVRRGGDRPGGLHRLARVDRGEPGGRGGFSRPALGRGEFDGGVRERFRTGVVGVGGRHGGGGAGLDQRRVDRERVVRVVAGHFPFLVDRGIAIPEFRRGCDGDVGAGDGQAAAGYRIEQGTVVLGLPVLRRGAVAVGEFGRLLIRGGGQALAGLADRAVGMPDPLLVGGGFAVPQAERAPNRRIRLVVLQASPGHSLQALRLRQIPRPGDRRDVGIGRVVDVLQAVHVQDRAQHVVVVDLLVVLAGPGHRPHDDRRDPVDRREVVLVPGQHEEAVVRLGPGDVGVELGFDPGIALRDGAVVHALVAVAHDEGDGGKFVETGRSAWEVRQPLVHRVQVVRGARNVLVAEPLGGAALVGVVGEAVPVGGELIGEVVGVDGLRGGPVTGLDDVRCGQQCVVIRQARVRNTIRVGERHTLADERLDVRRLVLRSGGRVSEDVVVALVLHHHHDHMVRPGNCGGSRDNRRPGN